MIAVCDFYCCLLPQCETLRTCRSGFPIATKWCCLRSVRVVVKRKGCCSNLSFGVALNTPFTKNGMCEKNSTHTHVARTSNNRMIAACDFYCCLLPQCEASRTCRSGFPIPTIPCSLFILCWKMGGWQTRKYSPSQMPTSKLLKVPISHASSFCSDCSTQPAGRKNWNVLIQLCIFDHRQG